MRKNKLLNSVVSQTILMIVNGIIGIALVPILINMLGKVNYGYYELILSLIIVNLFLEFGLGSTLIKYIPEYKDKPLNLRIFIWSYFYIKLFITFIAFIVLIFIGYYFDRIFNLEMIDNIESLKISVYIFAVGVVISSVSTFLNNILKGFVYFGIANFSNIFSILLFFIVIYMYYIFSNEYNIIHIAIIWFVLKPIFLIISSLLALGYVKLFPIIAPTRFDFNYIKPTIKYLLGMSYTVIVAQSYNRLPKILIGIFSGPIWIAYWGIMEKVRMPIQQIQNAMIRPLVPMLSDKSSITPISTIKIFQLIRIQYFFVSFLSIILIVHTDLIIRLWIGEEFIEASQLIRIWLLPFLLPNAGVFLMMYYAEGKTKVNNIFVTINAIVSLGIGTLSLTMFGDVVVFAYIFSITLILMNFGILVVYLIYFKIGSFEFIKKAVLAPLVISCSYFFIYKNIAINFNSDVYGLTISIFGSILIYVILFYIFMDIEDKREVSLLLQKLQKM